MTDTDAPTRPETDIRDEIPARFRWNLADIYPDWAAWEAACKELEALIEAYAACQGSLQGGAAALLKVLQLGDELGQLSYKVYFYPSLHHDEDQRDNSVDARRQQAQILIARSSEASAWFAPELLAIPLERLRAWLDEDEALAIYRFSLEEVYRQQEHVLDEGGERLLSLGARFNGSPGEVYAALTTADMKFPSITLVSGEEVTVTYGRYRAILAENREQRDRAAAFEALYGVYNDSINSYAAMYNAVAQRDWFGARARSYGSTLDAALHGNAIPEAVVETLIEATRAGAAPLQRYHRLRKQVLGLSDYHLYDGSIPLLELERKYPYEAVQGWIVESVAPLGPEYQARMREAFESRWIDVYENQGKRSGAYSAAVYGVHPYMLLNYNDTLDDMFTLAHEMGHSMHSILSHESQPFAYASYTIFVAEVASTLNEALLLDLLLERTEDPTERAVLLQHAIDSICGTFYTQVLFADWELQAHRMVEQGQPVTAETLGELYRGLIDAYYGDVVHKDELYAITWARIPHVFRTPYYVYQYATCFASSARILQGLRAGSEQERGEAVERYLNLLRSGSCDHPMELLRTAGADLSDRTTIQATVDQLGTLVERLERDLEQARR
jgi:oligoendopeptidase F